MHDYAVIIHDGREIIEFHNNFLHFQMLIIDSVPKIKQFQELIMLIRGLVLLFRELIPV